MVKARDIKKIVDSQQDRNIFAKDDSKLLAEPDEPEPNIKTDPIGWRNWDIKRQRKADAKSRSGTIDVSSSSKPTA